MADDGLPAARASDHIRLRRQVVAINHVLFDVQRRVFALEAIAADVRADLITAREVDEAITAVLDGLLEDVTGCR